MDPVRYRVYLNIPMITALIIHQICWATHVLIFTFAFTKVESLI